MTPRPDSPTMERMSNPEAKPKLLVVELWGLGDLIIASPFLRAAGRKYAVTLLAKPFAMDLQARFWPEINVIPLVAPWTSFKRKYRFHAWPWPEMLRLLMTLSRMHFDAGLSARWDPRDHIVLDLAGVKSRYGFPRIVSRIFLTHPLKKPDPQSHRSEYWAVLAQALGLDLPPFPGRQPASPGSHKGILIHSGAGQPVRVWPLERYRKLAGQLRGKNYSVQIACNTDQQNWWWQAGEKNVAAPRTVTELLALVDRAGAFIGNDSGPGHLAAFAGVPTFTIFGPQLPEWFAPLHPAAEWHEGKPCPYKPCSDYCRFPAVYCLSRLTAEEVWPKVEKFVTRHVQPQTTPLI